jgi:hypothetical protein
MHYNNNERRFNARKSEKDVGLCPMADKWSADGDLPAAKAE